MGAIVSMFVKSNAPMADDRVMRAMQTFRLSDAEVAPLWAAFQAYDKTRSGVISTTALFSDVLHEPRTLFTDGLFDLVDSADSEVMDFGEFVAFVTTYCFFEIPEILSYCFYVFDREKNGFIMKDEMTLFVSALHNNQVNTNVQ
ncbi:hypothetical protein M885DRAFT_522473 [Pelagophyceae sp. CCMP2097]|nr:hypothetical protein M885DRAFT_522473 [Pelagophyceae sp. CCMP2097]